MSKEKDKVQSIIEEPKQGDTQKFFDGYQKLCKEYGYQIVVTPAFRARDDGTWSVVLQPSIGKLPKQQ